MTNPLTDSTAEERSVAASAYLSGSSTAAAGALVGRCRATVERWLTQAGIPQRPKRSYFGANNPFYGKHHPPELQARLSASRRKYTFDQSFFSSIDTEAKAYTLGFLLADGCISDKGHVSATVKASDEGVLIAISRAMSSTCPVRRVEHKLNRPGYPTFVGRYSQFWFQAPPSMVSDLARHGVVPRKSLTCVPSGLIPLPFLPAYWRGLVDGDGWVTTGKAGRSPVIGLCGSRPVVEAFRDFCLSYVQSDATVHPTKRIFTFIIGGTSMASRMASVLYGGASIYVERKKIAADVISAMRPSWLRMTDSRAKEMIALRSELGCWKLVSQMYGLGDNSANSVVHSWLRKRGLSMPSFGRRPNPKKLVLDIEGIVKDYFILNKSTVQIGAERGVSYNTIRVRLIESGYDLNDGKGRPHVVTMTPELRAIKSARQTVWMSIPENRKIASAAAKEYHLRPEIRARSSETMKRIRSDPEFIRRMLEAREKANKKKERVVPLDSPLLRSVRPRAR